MAKYTDMNQFKKDFYNKLAKIVRAGALQCFQNIVIGSPVDSGRFRANWQASINDPKMTIVFNGVKAKLDGHGKPIKNQFNREENIPSLINNFKLDDILYLTNNLPYAQRLENGWSDQRGSGWIAQEVQNAKAAIKQAAGNIK